MDKKKSLRNKILWPVVGGILLYILMCIYADRQALVEAWSRLKVMWLPVVLALAFLNYVLRYVKFQYYLRVLNITLSWSTGFLVFLSSFVMAVTPGKMGEVVKSVFIKDLTGEPKSRTAPIVVAERITDLLAFVVMTLIGIPGFTQERSILYAVLLTFIGIVVFCALIGVRSFSLWAIQMLVNFPGLSRGGPKLLAAYESTYELIIPRRLLVATIISVPSWSCEVFAFYVAGKALGLEIPLGACFFIYSVGTILGAILFLPGGLGVTEVSITGLLVKIVGISTAGATSVTILIRLCTLWFAVVLGGVVFFILQKKMKGHDVLQEVIEAKSAES
jgi:glycosyltransferase 2 family protein